MGDKLVDRAPYTYCLGTICHRTTKWVAARPLHETLNMGRGSTQRAAISDSVPDFLPYSPPPPPVFMSFLRKAFRQMADRMTRTSSLPMRNAVKHVTWMTVARTSLTGKPVQMSVLRREVDLVAVTTIQMMET